MSNALSRFLASMKMTFDMWHDGTGYDLEALAQLSPEERAAIESVLLRHKPQDWRDIEALARIDSSPARAAIQAALDSPDAKVRREAVKHASAGNGPDAKERECLLLAALNNATLDGGLSDALDEVAEFHPPAVIDALLRGARDGDGEAAVHFAAMLYYLHGKATDPFDWDHRPFFLRFHTTDRAERAAAFRELCKTIGVDAEK